MNRRQRRAFMAQFDTQMEQERNGAPIPPDIAARMTQPKPQQMLYQVLVDHLHEDGTRKMLAVGPAMIREACEMFAETINRYVSDGKEKTWANARVMACTPLQGVH